VTVGHPDASQYLAEEEKSPLVLVETMSTWEIKIVMEIIPHARKKL
jgi:hypothetical protein